MLIVLNRHYAECEFQARCRQKTIEKDAPHDGKYEAFITDAAAESWSQCD
jgi:hypothetical protein